MATIEVYTFAQSGNSQKICDAVEWFKKGVAEGIHVIFGNWNDFAESHVLRQSMASGYAYPGMLWDDMCHLSNGYGGASRAEKTGKRVDTCWFHFLVKQLKQPEKPSDPNYHWFELSFYVHASSDTVVAFCFDCHEDFRGTLTSALSISCRPAPGRAFVFLQSVIVEQCVRLYDHATWTLRQEIRNIERARERSNNEDPDFAELHDLARHVIHNCEVLEVAVDTVKELLGPKEASEALCDCSAELDLGDDGRCPHTTMRFWLRMLRSFGHRSESLKARLSHEINLGLNVVIQRDSRINVKNSESMKTISLVTLVFLPSTFISTVFGTNFFNLSADPVSGRQVWMVSDNFWMYWVISIPLTIFTWICWSYGEREDIGRWITAIRRRKLRA